MHEGEDDRERVARDGQGDHREHMAAEPEGRRGAGHHQPQHGGLRRVDRPRQAPGVDVQPRQAQRGQHEHAQDLPAQVLPEVAALQGQHSPLHTLSGHRAAITSLVVGHSAGFCNIAVSASADQSCIVWDYHENQLLRTVLLPAVPRCLALDPADRAFYTAYDDGSVQIVDFYSDAFSAANPDSVQHPLYDPAQAAMPVQPPPQTRWTPPSADQGAALSAMLSYDGSTLMTGHNNGNVLVWDVPLGRYSSTFTAAPMMGPVTNLVSLPVQGFPDARPALPGAMGAV
ncbi:MAG: hypothetical protein EOO40_11600, partial [Deltaproteobacteria bacterium]